MKKALLISYVVFFVLPALKALPPDTIFITSPDKQIQFKLFLQQNQLQYAVTYKNVPVVTNSPMVLLMNDKEVTGAIKTKNINHYQVNEQYPWLGAHAPTRLVPSARRGRPAGIRFCIPLAWRCPR